MKKYMVTKDCYVPIGPGLAFRRKGQVVTLDDLDAAELKGFVKPVAKRNTPPIQRPEGIEGETGTVIDHLVTPPAEGVNDDASESQAADERAGGETAG